VTDTGDRDGKEERRCPPPNADAAAVQTALDALTGDIQQIPPRYSALKYKGRRYYDWARRGISIPRVARTVRIHSFTLLAHTPEYWEARVVCSRGTYIRTLAEDVAARLGSGSYVEMLVRERIGPYERAEGVTWSSLLQFNREALLSHVQEPNRHHAGIV
jgi:tRNA pseudouridine55 synthase